MMSYILLVNPQILGDAGMPTADVLTATAVASAVACFVMGLVANFPFALAPSMGLNAFFTYGVVLGLGVPWQTALTAVFIAGIAFMLLSMTGVRTKIIDGIPQTIKLAITTGIGLFLAIIGFQNIGLTVDHPATLLTRGPLSEPSLYLGLAGVLVMGALLIKRIKGAILIGILAVTIVAWVGGLATPPTALVAVPTVPDETLFALRFDQILSGTLLTVIVAFLFVDVFDTAGTLIGVGRLAGFLDDEGRLPGADKAFLADATGTTVGALLGTSPVTTYIESVAGVEEGGRTGLTAVVVGVLFLLSLFFSPVISAVPTFATGPALIVVGVLMMEGARHVEWKQIEDALPAFLTIVSMPFTYSIADGISLGIVSYTALRLITGRYREISPIMYVLSLLLVIYFATAA